MARGKTTRNKALTVGMVIGLVGLMVTLTAFAVPLYRLFCQVTGYGGTTQTAQAAPAQADERWITVRFNADTARGMPWEFRPDQREIKVRVGEQALAFYTARNPTGRAVTGQATYNVTPQKAGFYFVKIDCFCFNEQRLEPGQSVDMPVTFYVDPALYEDPGTSEVTTITLSYTFFERGDATENAASARLEADAGSAAN